VARCQGTASLTWCAGLRDRFESFDGNVAALKTDSGRDSWCLKT